jgi:Tfp pilus assembly protein PilF
MLNKGKIVLFPQLLERHLEMAMAAREQGDIQKARSHLEQAHALQPEDVSVLFGLMVIYFEIGLNRESEQLAQQLLQLGGRETGEVLHFYVLNLMKQDKYEEAYEVLDPIVNDPSLSEALRREFTEIFNTCQLICEARTFEEEASDPLLRRMVSKRLHAEPEYFYRLLRDVEEGDPEKQIQAIEQLQYSGDPKARDAIQKLVLLPEANPAVKTTALYALRELGCKRVSMIKFNQAFEVDLDILPAQGELGKEEQEVVELLEEVVDHKDPSLIYFGSQLWSEFLYACYPHIPSMKNREGWAAAIHFVTLLSMGQKRDKSEIASLYSVSVPTLTNNYNRILEVLGLHNWD